MEFGSAIKMTGLYWFFSPSRIANGEIRVAKRLQVFLQQAVPSIRNSTIEKYAHWSASGLMNTFRRCQSFFRKALVLFATLASGTTSSITWARNYWLAMVLHEYLKKAGYAPARFQSTWLSTDCYRIAVNKNLMRKRLAYAHNVFDVGANVGVWTVLMSKFNPSARIHSFEPNSATFNLLEVNVKENSCGNVTLINAAASDQEGTALFEVPTSASIFGRIRSHRTADRFGRSLSERTSVTSFAPAFGRLLQASRN